MMAIWARIGLFFFFNDTATTEIYTLSLHDALPIFLHGQDDGGLGGIALGIKGDRTGGAGKILGDRKSTRLNSSHQIISYAVFSLKKKQHAALWALAVKRLSSTR